MKKVIGQKSYGEIILYGIGVTFFLVIAIVVGFLFGIGHGPDEETMGDFTFVMLIIILPIMAIYLVVLFIKTINLPKDLIYIVDRSLIIYNQKNYQEIPLEEIILVTPMTSHGRSIHYTFGTIHIHTSEVEYRVGHVASCEKVCLEIMKLVKNVSK